MKQAENVCKFSTCILCSQWIWDPFSSNMKRDDLKNCKTKNKFDVSKKVTFSWNNFHKILSLHCSLCHFFFLFTLNSLNHCYRLAIWVHTCQKCFLYDPRISHKSFGIHKHYRKIKGSNNTDWRTINPFAPNALFLGPRKTSQNCKVFWCFQGVEKGCIGKKWVKHRQLIITSLQRFPEWYSQ